MKFRYKINNLAYARDCELTAWFLGCALEILKTWPVERHHWWGDQEAWGAVLGLPVEDLDALPAGLRRVGGEEEHLIAATARGEVHAYPNVTHNCPGARDGSLRAEQLKAFMVHLKGARKQHLDRFMSERFA